MLLVSSVGEGAAVRGISHRVRRMALFTVALASCVAASPRGKRHMERAARRRGTAFDLPESS